MYIYEVASFVTRFSCTERNSIAEEKHGAVFTATLVFRFPEPWQTSWGSRGPSPYRNMTVRTLQQWTAHPKTTHRSEPPPRTTTPLYTHPSPTTVRVLLSPDPHAFASSCVVTVGPTYITSCVACVIHWLFLCKIVHSPPESPHCAHPSSTVISNVNIQ